MNVNTYNINAPPSSQYSFYVLSKGLNSGRPMSRPCANCFVVKARDETERWTWFGYTYVLWRTGKFLELQVGTVIPFLRIHEYRNVMLETINSPIVDHKRIETIMNQVMALKNRQDVLMKEIGVYKKLEDTIIKRCLKL